MYVGKWKNKTLITLTVHLEFITDFLVDVYGLFPLKKKILLFRPLCHIFLSEGDYLKGRNYAYTSHLVEQFSLHSQCLMNLRQFEVFGLSRNVPFHMAVLHPKYADEAQVSKLEVPERRASVHYIDHIMYIVVFLHFNTVRNSAEASNKQSILWHSWLLYI